MISPRGRMAIFTSSMHGGGAQRAMLKLAQGMAEGGFTVDLVLVRAEGPYLAEVPEAVRIVDLKASRVSGSLLPLVRYLRRERPEFLISALSHVNVIALWGRKLTGVPRRVLVNEQNTLSQSAQLAPRRRGRPIRRLIRWSYPWADGIVAVSKGVADDLAQQIGISRERIQVIHNPIITPELWEKAQAPLEHPWFGPGELPVVLAVGRLHPQKDYPTLLEAFAQVRQTRPARLLILGEGEERSKLEALIRQLGLEQDVSLPGFVQNPYAYMARASAFVLSSRWEGLPSVLIEALYCGAPLVATDCPSGPREILADGQYGKLVPVGDVKALAGAIEVALAGGTASPPQESWQPYALKTVVDQYCRLLEG
jgi:glycosyltransferase involved in cell wall biosynthesis